MRIAFVCFEAFQTGGIRTYTRELLNGIAAAGHSVMLFAPPPPGSVTGLGSQVAVRTLTVPQLPLTSAPTFELKLPFALRQAERENGLFDIVHSNTYSDVLLPRFAVEGVRVTTVHHLGTSTARSMGLSVLDMLTHPTSEYGPGLALEGLTLRRADHLIAVSEFTRREILKTYPDIDPSRITVVYHGACSRLATPVPDAMDRLKKRWGIEDGHRILLFVGRLEERKGISLLMKAFALLGSRTNTKLLLVGLGRSSEYESLARKLSIADQVVFTGFVEETELNAAYALATALVHPASLEGFGITVADALASGLPVVATRVGSIPELVTENVDGFLSEPGNPRAFADAITKVLDGSLSMTAGNRLRGSTRFTWEKAVCETLGVYETLVESRSLRRSRGALSR